jgi:hypothetical protein
MEFHHYSNFKGLRRFIVLLISPAEIGVLDTKPEETELEIADARQVELKMELN